jgi:hypothetical protein
MKKSSTDTWVLLAVFVGLLIGGYILAAPNQRDEYKVSTTYNADPLGVKAFYTLLGDRLRYNVGRLRKPYTEMPSGARLLICVQPRTKGLGGDLGFGGQYHITKAERDALTQWVRKGGTAVFLADNLEGIPAAFGSDQRMGRGYIYAFNSRRIITNRGMRDYRNALRVLGILDRHVGKDDLILFDEYHHGIAESRSLWSYVSRQVWFAIAVLAVAAGVLCHTRGRRFGAVRSVPKSEGIRPGYEFVESVARLYRRAHASDLAEGILCSSFKHGLCAKLGMPADAPTELISRRILSDLGSETAARVGQVLTACDGNQAGRKPSEQELLDVAREIRELEKELGIGGVNI